VVSGIDRAHRHVIFAASLGTVFEFYDFFLYGSLASIISKQFFAGINETTAFIFALLTFSAGFAVRPFGALVFGRLGDLVGRKRTFLITMVIMGAATAMVGLLPGYATAGVLSPIALVLARMLQGLAVGGEYGGATIYVAEHASLDKRGLYTSWIQGTGTAGLLLSLIVIMLCRAWLGPQFETWGWRVPFLFSVALLVFSVYIRLQLQESPVFREMAAQGTRSKAPVLDSFGRWSNLRTVLLALFGGTAAITVVYYCGQFYSMFFLTQILKVDPQAANLLMAAALVLGAPFFVLFGRLSDHVGRKRLVLGGCFLAAATYFPVFKAITHFANPAIEEAAHASPLTVLADPDSCSLQLDLVGKRKFVRSCDIAKAALAKAGVPYRSETGTGTAMIRIGRTAGHDAVIPAFEGAGMSPEEFKSASERFTAALGTALKAAGYPAKADPARINYPMVLAMLWILMLYVALTFGPFGAWLVELFPARIRYTSLSVPYHLGVGWIGGFLPTVAFAIVAITGDIYSGLWYPVIIAAGSALLGVAFLPETLIRAETLTQGSRAAS
jgi:MFS family permease